MVQCFLGRFLLWDSGCIFGFIIVSFNFDKVLAKVFKV